MAALLKSDFICFACKHFIEELSISHVRCKAFSEKNGTPENINNLYPETHKIVRKEQGNAYIFEPLEKYKNKSRYKEYDDILKLKNKVKKNTISDFNRFDISLYIGAYEDYLLDKIPFSWLDDIQMNTSKINDFLSQFNKSGYALQVKQLLESGDENKIRSAFEKIKEGGVPSDIALDPSKFNALLFTNEEEYYKMNFLQAIGHLEELNLSNMSIAILPNRIGDFQKLSYLYLSRNQLRSLPPAIGNLTNLVRLDLFDNQIADLPDELGSLTLLQQLDLYSNRIEVIPKGIYGLVRLKYLGFNHNQIVNIPQDIGKLSDLEGLYLENNLFNEFPSNIFRLTRLKYLYISGNQLPVIPEGIGELRNLRWLGLAHNQLAALPHSLGGLRRLEWLDLRGNPISEIEQANIKKLLPYTEILFS